MGGRGASIPHLNKGTIQLDKDIEITTKNGSIVVKANIYK